MEQFNHSDKESLAWWKKAVAYQIYPRSFFDTNNDGIGDLKGVIEKLDYLAELGVDLIWICPFYQSPNDDNGYDISDYQAVNPDFGTLEEVDILIKSAHQRGIRIIIDLVINHTSDEHSWFMQSRQSKDDPKRDWYIWRDASEPTADKITTDPNNWESIFHGSAWEFDALTEQYYLHLFSKKQPDLNWQNPQVKEALFDMIRWWIKRGVDGFRVDAISHIHKKPGLPCLANPLQEPYVSSFDYHMNVAGIESHLQQLKENAFDPFDIVTVGEANGVSCEQAKAWVGEAEQGKSGIFDMIFQFEHMSLWAEDQKREQFNLVEFKTILSRWQQSLEGFGWNALYLENHDQARSINTFADPHHWYASATALAACYFLMKGTPFIYQGQEIGMLNHQFSSLDAFNDVSAKNLIKKLRLKGKSDDDILELLNQVSRDHSRLPMQWNTQSYAGFSTYKPWIEVNPNYIDINVEQQQQDKYSIWHFYQQLIVLRKTNDSLITGRYHLLLEQDPYIYAYQRQAQDKTWTIITNLSGNKVELALDLCSLGELILHNQTPNNPQAQSDILTTQIATPFGAFIFCKEN